VRAGSADAAPPGGARVLAAPSPCVEAEAVVPPRPAELRASTALFASIGSFQSPQPESGIVAIEDCARPRQPAGVSRWCVAHATSTQAP